MKLQVMSDLHLEFDPDFRVPYAGADVLVLSGDICVVDVLGRGEASVHHWKSKLFRDFFKDCVDNFDHVVYVKGNHESYHGRVDKTTEMLKETLGVHSNLHVLDDEVVEIDGVAFLGTTLWTDLNKGDPITEAVVKNGMNDFRLITIKDGGTYRKFQPFDMARMHAKAKQFIETNAALFDKVVVVGHHAPSEQSVDEQYAQDHYFNGAYCSNLDYFIESMPQVKLWTHGHMHTCADYVIGETRVVCNPKGYYDQNKYFEPEKVFEI